MSLWHVSKERQEFPEFLGNLHGGPSQWRVQIGCMLELAHWSGCAEGPSNRVGKMWLFTFIPKDAIFTQSMETLKLYTFTVEVCVGVFWVFVDKRQTGHNFPDILMKTTNVQKIPSSMMSFLADRSSAQLQLYWSSARADHRYTLGVSSFPPSSYRYRLLQTDKLSIKSNAELARSFSKIRVRNLQKFQKFVCGIIKITIW